MALWLRIQGRLTRYAARLFFTRQALAGTEVPIISFTFIQS